MSTNGTMPLQDTTNIDLSDSVAYSTIGARGYHGADGLIPLQLFGSLFISLFDFSAFLTSILHARYGTELPSILR